MNCQKDRLNKKLPKKTTFDNYKQLTLYGDVQEEVSLMQDGL